MDKLFGFLAVIFVITALIASIFIFFQMVDAASDAQWDEATFWMLALIGLGVGGGTTRG